MKNPKMHVGTSPLTNRICAGRLASDGETWAGQPGDVTVSAVVAVAEHVVRLGKPAIITEHGVPKYEIHVRDLAPGPAHGNSSGPAEPPACGNRDATERDEDAKTAGPDQPSIAAGSQLSPWMVAVALLKLGRGSVHRLALRHGFWLASSQSEAVRAATAEAKTSNPGFKVALVSAKAVPRDTPATSTEGRS